MDNLSVINRTGFSEARSIPGVLLCIEDDLQLISRWPDWLLPLEFVWSGDQERGPGAGIRKVDWYSEEHIGRDATTLTSTCRLSRVGGIVGRPA